MVTGIDCTGSCTFVHRLNVCSFQRFLLHDIVKTIYYIPFRIISGVRVTRSLILYVCFVDCCLSFCTFSFGHSLWCLFFFDIRILITSLWYLQTLLATYLSIANKQKVCTSASSRFVYKPMS